MSKAAGYEISMQIFFSILVTLSRMEVGGNSLPIVVSEAIGGEILRSKFNKESTRSIKNYKHF